MAELKNRNEELETRNLFLTAKMKITNRPHKADC